MARARLPHFLYLLDKVPFTVYLIKYKGYIYTGQTGKVHKRLGQHRKWGENWELIHTEEFKSRDEAVGREKQIKNWSRAKKLALAAGNIRELKKLARPPKRSSSRVAGEPGPS